MFRLRCTRIPFRTGMYQQTVLYIGMLFCSSWRPSDEISVSHECLLQLERFFVEKAYEFFRIFFCEHEIIIHYSNVEKPEGFFLNSHFNLIALIDSDIGIVFGKLE